MRPSDAPKNAQVCPGCNGWGGYNDITMNPGPDKKHPFADATVANAEYGVKCEMCDGRGWLAPREEVVAELVYYPQTHSWWPVKCLNLKGDYSGSNCGGFAHGNVLRKYLAC
jgi:hypothetical protein